MMSTYVPARARSRDLSGVRTSSSPIDHALTLLLADETEAALRWGAAALERDPLLPSAFVVTSRLLDQMGRMRAAIDGLRLAVRRAIDTGDLPLAVAAIDDLRILGADVREPLDQVAAAFCRGSPRLEDTPPSPADARFADFLEPLSPFLAGPPLASRATQIILAAKQAHDAASGVDRPAVPAWPLFSALTRDALRDLLAAFHVVTVPAGQRILDEDVESDAAYIIAHGEVELSRRAGPGEDKPRLALSSLGHGAFFGEMALLSRLPSATTATATRPSILLVGKRDALVAVAAKRPEVAIQLAAHCRRTSLANLGWTSAVVALIPREERAALVERLQMRVFERGEKLVRDREEAKGLHLVVSGEVAIVGREWSERVLLATLGPGETVGEVELVLCRQSYADAIAMRPTAALFLSREEYSALVQDRPAVLHGLYSSAVRRHAETRLALDAGSAPVSDDWLSEEDQTETRVVSGEKREPGRALPPRAPRAATARVAVPGPSPLPVSADEPTAVVATAFPSVAPTSASLPPASSRAPARWSPLPLTFAAGAALAVCAAAVTSVFIVREGQRAATAVAIPVQATAVAAAPAQTAASTPTEAPAAPRIPTSAPILATVRERAARPAPAPRYVAPPAPPADVAPPARPKPPSPVAGGSRPPAIPSASAKAIGPPPAAPASASTASPPVADEFGGRE
jgi:CRP-like cAMP-binding protein